MRLITLILIATPLCAQYATINPGDSPANSLNTLNAKLAFTVNNSAPGTCVQGKEVLFQPTPGILSFCDTTNHWTQILLSGQSSSGLAYCAPSSNSATTYTCSPSPAVTLTTGANILFIPDVVSGSTPTINVNSTGAKSTVFMDGSTATSSGFFRTSQAYLLVYDGTSWRTTSNCWPGPVIGSVSYTQLTAAATSQQFSILPNISGDASFAQATLQASTQFAKSAGTITTLTFEMGRSGAGNTDEWIPAFDVFTSAASTAPQWFWEDRPARALIGSGNNYDMYLTARASNTISGVTFTAGVVKWSIGPACYSGATQ